MSRFCPRWAVEAAVSSTPALSISSDFLSISSWSFRVAATFLVGFTGAGSIGLSTRFVFISVATYAAMANDFDCS